MKSIYIRIIVAVMFASSVIASAQGTFQDLNFEEANPVYAGSPYPAYEVTTASALPGWTVYYGTTQEAVVGYNTESLGATQVDLLGASYGAIEGNYSVLLQGGIEPSVPATISQYGMIPAATETLFFEAQPGRGTLDVSIGSQIVPFSAVGSGANYTLYGANISAWAGDPELLTFSALPPVSSDNNWLIDDISFSTNAPSPEPSIVALTAIGGLLFGARKWFARR
jgi:hypothetical protein